MLQYSLLVAELGTYLRIQTFQRSPRTLNFGRRPISLEHVVFLCCTAEEPGSPHKQRRLSRHAVHLLLLLLQSRTSVCSSFSKAKSTFVSGPRNPTYSGKGRSSCEGCARSGRRERRERVGSAEIEFRNMGPPLEKGSNGKGTRAPSRGDAREHGSHVLYRPRCSRPIYTLRYERRSRGRSRDASGRRGFR